MISIYANGPLSVSGRRLIKHSSWNFPGGEIGVRIDGVTDLRYSQGVPTVWARLRGHSDVMELLMIADAVKRIVPTFRLVLPYVPYGRQDRVCCAGESHSLRVFASLVNSLGAESVHTFDPHSDVTPALLDRCTFSDQKALIGNFDELNAYMQPNLPADRPVLVSPDAGANKKTADLATFYNHSYFIRADKLRDLATGKIKEIVVVNPKEDVEGRKCLIVDDLGDRCGTFLGLAKALKQKGAKDVGLYITHALFTLPSPKDVLNPLFDAGITHIWATNSYRTDLKDLNEPRLSILDLEESFAI